MKKGLKGAIDGLMEATRYQGLDGETTPEMEEIRRRDGEPNPKATIDSYLWAMEKTLAYAREGEGGKIRVLGEVRDDDVQLHRRTWALLKRARIFDIPKLAWMLLYHMTDRYTDEVIGESSGWRPVGAEPPDDPVEQEAVGKRISAYYLSDEAQPGWPETHPFEAMFIGLGGGVMLTSLGMTIRNLPREIDAAVLRGLLVDEANQRIVEILHMYVDGGTKEGIGVNEMNAVDGYNSMELMTMTPSIFSVLIDYINEHRSIVIEKRPNMNDRYAFKRSAKRQRSKLLPKPYYIVPLKTKVFDERLAKSFNRTVGRRVVPGHRFDVRAHERVRLQRGELPLDHKDEEKLRKRGYRIYKRPDSIQGEDARRLMERKVPALRTGEWIAILVSWVDAYVKGPDDAPYVPAVRQAQHPVRRLG